jgi:hypothetical protein
MITTDKAIERLAFTITKQNKPNQTDLESLKIIAEFIENSKKKEITDSYLFAKMYVYNFIHEVMYYNESYEYNYKFSQQKLHNVLSDTLENTIKIAMSKLNTHEYQLLIENLGMTANHFVIRNLEQIENDKQITENNKEILLKFAKGFYEYEDFEERIKDQIVFCINNYKDLP